MSRTDLTADDVILDLLVEGVEPTYENLAAAVAAYPQHRDALADFFASLAVQSALGPETGSSGCEVERFANIGVSRVLALRHQRAQLAASSSVPARLCELVKARGLTSANLGERVGLDAPLIMKLDRRRIRGPRPMEMFERLGLELGVPPAHVIASSTGPPLASSRGNLRKAQGTIRVETETFEEAIRNSTLTYELQAFWLGLLADEGQQKA